MIRRSFLAAVVAALSLAAAPMTLTAQTKPKPLTGPGPMPSPSVPAQDKVATRSTWSFLSLEATRVETFLRAHSTYDGRGVIVMIFDTGVDPGIPGLLKTTEGKQKIIDVRDFSGTGDVVLQEAQRSGDILTVDGKTVLKGLSSLKSKPVFGQYLYGVLPEKRFQNGLGDLNFNGEYDDEFGVVVFEDTQGHYTAYVDSDGDQDLSDEQPTSNFHEKYETFAFHPADSASASTRQLHGAVNIASDARTVSVYFDDGSHGTHVAGIAAGHDIDNQKGFNGVAPGAEIIACKFADNNAGGVTVSGSMQKAFLYAAELAKTQSKPVVVNMSFGIGSEIEGKSAMDKWLDSLLAATPNLSVCISAGNEGPGLSSVGLPGSSERVITSGAALPDDAARDLYNMYITKPVVFDFSSRGGEIAKPDVISPGTAVSTVPDYVGGDRYNGTSMSSPYTTGCVALLLSAMKQEFPNWTPNANMVKRALQLSAHPLENQNPLDQGYGMVDVPDAYELLARWIRRGFTPPHVNIVTSVPTQVRSSTAAYYRSGVYPQEGERSSFSISTSSNPNASAHERAVGMEAFDLVSDEPWLMPLQSSIYRRGEGGLDVEVRYNTKLLQKPGLYTGRIWAYEKGGEKKRSESRFELLNTVIIPYQFSDQNAYHVTLNDLKLAPGVVQRSFFAVPPGTKSMRFDLSTRDPKAGCNASLFDNEGHGFSGFGIRRGSSARTSTLLLTGRDLETGVIELDLSRTMSSEDEREMTVDLTADAQPLELTTQRVSMPQGGLPKAAYTLTNPTTRSLQLQPEAVIGSYERSWDTVIKSGDLFTLPFAPNAGDRSISFDLSMPAEDYNLFTDVTCMVLKPDSSAVFNSAWDVRGKVVTVNFGQSDDEEDAPDSSVATGASVNISSGTPYLLYVKGGLALPDHPRPWRLRIRERRVLQTERYMSSTPSTFTLNPYQQQDIEFKGDRELPDIPVGYHYSGSLNLKQSDENTIRIPMTF